MKGKIMYKIYTGDEECHSHIGKSGSTRLYYKCTNKAKYNIGNGMLRCEHHFKIWAKKKGIILHRIKAETLETITDTLKRNVV